MDALDTMEFEDDYVRVYSEEPANVSVSMKHMHLQVLSRLYRHMVKLNPDARLMKLELADVAVTDNLLKALERIADMTYTDSQADLTPAVDELSKNEITDLIKVVNYLDPDESRQHVPLKLSPFLCTQFRIVLTMSYKSTLPVGTSKAAKQEIIREYDTDTYFSAVKTPTHTQVVFRPGPGQGKRSHQVTIMMAHADAEKFQAAIVKFICDLLKNIALGGDAIQSTATPILAFLAKNRCSLITTSAAWMEVYDCFHKPEGHPPSQPVAYDFAAAVTQAASGFTATGKPAEPHRKSCGRGAVAGIVNPLAVIERDIEVCKNEGLKLSVSLSAMPRPADGNAAAQAAAGDAIFINDDDDDVDNED